MIEQLTTDINLARTFLSGTIATRYAKRLGCPGDVYVAYGKGITARMTINGVAHYFIKTEQ